MDLTTRYLGLTLKNPIVVASCGLTKSVDQVKKCEDAGAAAVVLKSIFEEQIRETDSGLDDSMDMHPEALGYIRSEIEMQYGPREYIDIVRNLKQSVSIPVIASVNCHSSKWWTSYGYQLEAAGADALELNVYVLPYDLKNSGSELEKQYVEVLKAVKAKVKIPVALKLAPFFTSFGHFAEQLDNCGVDGFVLFNRFIQPDINIDTMSSLLKPSFNDPVGFNHSLRWTALLSGKLKADIAAGGNIKTSEDVIKQILAGANVIQIASVLYKEGLGKIKDMETGLKNWMTEKKFASIDDFRGKLNQENTPQTGSYIRAQYIKTIAGIE